MSDILGWALLLAVPALVVVLLTGFDRAMGRTISSLPANIKRAYLIAAAMALAVVLFFGIGAVGYYTIQAIHQGAPTQINSLIVGNMTWIIAALVLWLAYLHHRIDVTQRALGAMMENRDDW